MSASYPSPSWSLFHGNFWYPVTKVRNKLHLFIFFIFFSVSFFFFFLRLMVSGSATLPEPIMKTWQEITGWDQMM